MADEVERHPQRPGGKTPPESRPLVACSPQATQQPATATTTALARLRPRIIVLVGLPGCGKTTFVERLRAPVLSSDHIRRLLADDENNQLIHNRVFATIRYLLRHRLAIGRPITYIDATHLTPSERRPYIILGQIYNCSVEALYFDVPVEVCKQRNRQRARVVPEEVIDRMAARLVPPSKKEGFSRIWVVRA